MKRAVAGALCVGVLACGLAFWAHVYRERHEPELDASVDRLLAALVAEKRPASAGTAVVAACKHAEPCACAESATRAALDADLYEIATRVLNAVEVRCGGSATFLGQRAEALVRSGATESAQRAIDLALKLGPANPYAELAQARVAFDKSQMGLCTEHADSALKYGRGPEGERLAGRCALARSLYSEAEGHFARLLAANPDDAEAAFTDAICCDKLGDYRGAREGFLQTLRIDPKHVPARTYLVVLTYKAGAKDEARHHLQKLTEILPNGSPKLVELERLLDGTDQDGGAPDAGVVNPINGKPMVQGKL
jgi:tetratricopeptide (TPR) repeat protein